MPITRQDVLHAADLARLELDPAAVDTYAGQLDEILSYVAQLESVDTTGVAPTANAVALENAFRQDRPGEHLNTELALRNAPGQEDGSFIVPKVIA